jgi:DNA topoisomerase I
MAQDLASLALQQGLVHVAVSALTISRRRAGRGFSYCDAAGATIRDRGVRARIKALAIPPAWEEVRIAADARCHIQAIGRDSEGRLQYRYHDAWDRIRDEIKAERLLRFGRALPHIREKMRKDLRRDRPDRRFAAAVAARLIERALLRAGHDSQACETEGGRGATTLLKRDVEVNGSEVSLSFVGKSGKPVRKAVRDPILTSRMRRLKSIGRKRLFAYRGEGGRRRYLTARDLNAYLKDLAGRPVTAKDFRTFAASAQALAELCRTEPPGSASARKREMAQALRHASEELNNTPAVTRSSYVHPSILEAYECGELSPAFLKDPPRRGLSVEETALMRFLERRLG